MRLVLSSGSRRCRFQPQRLPPWLATPASGSPAPCVAGKARGGVLESEHLVAEVSASRGDAGDILPAVGTGLVSSSSVAKRNRSALLALAWEPHHGPGCQVLGTVIAARASAQRRGWLPGAAGALLAVPSEGRHCPSLCEWGPRANTGKLGSWRPIHEVPSPAPSTPTGWGSPSFPQGTAVTLRGQGAPQGPPSRSVDASGAVGHTWPRGWARCECVCRKCVHWPAQVPR